MKFRAHLTSFPLAVIALALTPLLTHCSSAPPSAGGAPAPAAPSPSPEAASAPERSEPTEPPEAPTTARLQASVDTELLRDVGFDGPSAVLVDSEQDVYLVSNVAGDPTAEDDNGFISRVRPDKTVEARFIEGGKKGVTLHAPRGMAVTHDTLVVADGSALRLFDRRTGAPRGRLAVQGATLLDGLALGAGQKTLYVADRGPSTGSAEGGAGAVYRVVDGKISRVARGPELGGPSALWPDAGGTWVVGQQSGELYFLNNSGRRDRVHEVTPLGLQGVVKIPDGRFLLSSAGQSAILQGHHGKSFTPLLEGVTAPGNLAYDKKRHRLLVPLYEEDVLVLHRLKEATNAPQ